MSQPKSGGDKTSEDNRQSHALSNLSVGKQTITDFQPEQYGNLLRQVSSMTTYLPKTKKAVTHAARMPLPPTVSADTENTIEKETKALLLKVDTLVSVMEKMSIGPISVDNYRYEAINKELQELSKMATKKELSLEPLSPSQLNNFNQKLLAVELEIRDIYSESDDDKKSSGDDHQSHALSSLSDGKHTTTNLQPEQYGNLLRQVSSITTYLPKTKKAVAHVVKMPLQTTVEADTENTIEKETKALLLKVDTLVSVMEKMSIGPISVDNYRYEAINKELQELSKMATKKELSLEQISPLQLNKFNQKLLAVELEIRDIYTSWIEYYSATVHEVFQQCTSLYKRMTMLKTKNKKQKLLLYNITEFSSYAAAQKSSLYKLIHKPYQALPAVTTIDEIHERISSLETMLNTPLPISFGNVPRSSVGTEDKKKTKSSKTDKKKEQKMESSGKSKKKSKSKDKTQVKFQEPEARVQQKNIKSDYKQMDREAKISNAPIMKQTGEPSIGKKK